MLHGRASEVGAIERLLAAARAGHSGVLVLRGEAGVGKTALLDHAAAAATNQTVLRCAGVESEAELPFAGLHQLLRPHRNRIAALPDPQAAALRAAFGLADSAAHDRFLAGLATLTLLSELAAERPVLALVDDEQWLDHASAQALAFVGRRLDAEGVLLIVATRAPAGGSSAGLPELTLGGLDTEAAGALLDELPYDLPPATRARLIEETGGNPLALIEFARGEPSTPTGPAAAGESAVQLAFARQIGELPAPTRTALLLAAADDTGDAAVVLAAAARLGLDPADLSPAESAGLLAISDGTAVFRHPIARSAAYHRAPLIDRLAAHRALADVLSSPDQADRRAWHLASAATAPDDTVAAELDRAADRATLRGGYAASAAARERAARLTADVAERSRRLAAAADNARDAGQLASAARLADEAATLTADSRVGARLAMVRARVEFELGAPERAAYLQAIAARDADPVDAAGMLIESVRMSFLAPSTDVTAAVEGIAAVRCPVGDPVAPVLRASAILGRLIAGHPPAEVPSLRAAVADIHPDDLRDAAPSLRGHATSLRLLAGHFEESFAQARTLVELARRHGMIGGLPHLLILYVVAALDLGRPRDAFDAALEGVRISEDTGQTQSAVSLRGMVARAAAITGDEERCAAEIEVITRHGRIQHNGLAMASAALARCEMELARGRYGSALDVIDRIATGPQPHPILAFRARADQIEAAARSGRLERAAQLLAGYEQWVDRHQHGFAAEVRRCRALIASDDAVDAEFQSALRAHHEYERPLSRARTELLYGEWLRRAHRRTEARAQLRSAADGFEFAGATLWVERARAELRAAGETVSDSHERFDLLRRLTPQELQVARLAASGLTNRDIGAQLFLSPRTVGYHLYKTYPKLGISGRSELARMNLG